MLPLCFAAAMCGLAEAGRPPRSIPVAGRWDRRYRDTPAGRPPPPPAPPPPALTFSDTCGDWMVLQMAPAKAAVSGFLNVSQPDTVEVSVSGGGSSYKVQANVTTLASDPENPGSAGFKWKAFLRPSKAGGDITITASSGAHSAKISHVTMGDVWYCSGQSNMALPLVHTMSRNISATAIRAGKYKNLRIHGMAGNMNPYQNWSTVSDALAELTTGKKGAGNPVLFTFSSTCYYFGESLIDHLGADAPPIGLIHTAWGGSRIEAWVDNSTLATCSNSTGQPVPASSGTAKFHQERVVPYLDSSIKGWVWYQGENDMHTYFGNSARSSGYSCLMEKLVSSWRTQWSAEAGTTDPNAPFGVVTLAPSGGEGGADLPSMRWAQTASYGVLPNPVMPNTFLAQAYDLNDPFANITCYKSKCCDNNFNLTVCNEHHANAFEDCKPYCASVDGTNFYMGPIHPRSKKQVGVRLAQGAAVSSYGKSGPVTGPTISGCAVSGDKITIKFNTTLLSGGKMNVQEYFKGVMDPETGKPTGGSSKMQVLVNASAFCLQTHADPILGLGDSGHGGPKDCWDDGTGHTLGPGNYDSGENWITVDVTAGTEPGTVEVDLAKAGGRKVSGIRYAWEGTCCDGNPATFEPCPLASCPIMGYYSGNITLPANPFTAHIVGGKCKCVEPQTCDE